MALLPSFVLVLCLAQADAVPTPAAAPVPEAEASTRAPAPHRERYFVAPSGMMLRSGELTLAQTELVYTSVNYGVTDHLTLSAGTALPLWFFENGFSLSAGLKAGGTLGERLHLSASAQVLAASPALRVVVGLFLGTATYGTPDANLSLSVGLPVALKVDEPLFPLNPALILCGTVRLGTYVALVTEHWFFPNTATDTYLPLSSALGVRLMGGHFSVDLGLVYTHLLDAGDSIIPFYPWLDVAYRFD